ncbi:PGN_0703 family putative restriction endonuclease [Gemmata sp.]|uniref:PGN_0703 family putative restriction endonuclease n=1 Tax=Gemmata sp. TaxID=1914242 RepID=UPI003F72FB6C
MSDATTRRAGVPNFSSLPYGAFDLNPHVQLHPGPPERIRCFVKGCKWFLRPPTRHGFRGDACPDHGIRVHKSGTYSYRDPGRNTIVSPELLTHGVMRHEFKFESGRFGNERGEDAITFNVFRSFQEAGALHLVASLFTGTEVVREPRLFLWGLEMTGDTLEPWDLLIAARERFETALPVKRPMTEPDIALHLPGEWLLLCEAKFTSANPVYARGPRKDAQSLTLDELVGIYSDPALVMLDDAKVAAADRIEYQLFRNVRFAETMARLDGPNTQPFFVNLTRLGAENDTFEHFFRLLRPGHARRVRHVFWEQLFTLSQLVGGRLGHLQRYLITKTAGLRLAFNLGYF